MARKPHITVYCHPDNFWAVTQLRKEIENMFGPFKAYADKEVLPFQVLVKDDEGVVGIWNSLHEERRR